MEKKNNTSGTGIGFVGLLQIAFIVLKLCGVISWSWLWVFAPIWMSVAFVLTILIIGILYILIKHQIRMNRAKKNLKKQNTSK